MGFFKFYDEALLDYSLFVLAIILSLRLLHVKELECM